MAALGGLLGAYGSEDEDEEMQEEPQETQKTGQVTLLDDDDAEGGVDLTHLTAGGALQAAAAAAGAAQQQEQQGAPGPRPGSAGSQQVKGDGGAAEAAAAADGGGPQAAGGGGEQPPAGGGEGQQQEDPLALLPPEMRERPEAECYPDVQARVAQWLHLQRTRGRYINQEIRKSRGYRNPEFFAKMVEHLEIDQHGSSFAPEVFDPKGLPPEDFLDALQREWAAEEERRKAARAAGQGRVEFHKSASNPSLVQPQLKPGLQQPAGVVTAASIAAKAAAQQQQQQPQAPINTAAAVAAAQARAAAIAAQLAQAQRR